jgi:hypothetical protein
MVRFLLATLAVVLFVRPLLAQDDRLDQLDFEEGTLTDEKIPYFAVGAGGTVSLAILPMDEVNAHARQYVPEDLSGSMILAGFDVFAAVPLIPGTRIGFSWITGSSFKETTVTEQAATATRRYTYDIGQRSLYIDYALVPAKSLYILPGVGLTWSTQTLEMRQGIGSRTWTSIQPTNGVVPPDPMLNIQRQVISVQPRLNVEYAVTPFLCLRGQASYNLQVSGGDWLAQGITTITDAPEGIKVQHFSAQFGVFIGLFN